jgi:hypothetical protein
MASPDYSEHAYEIDSVDGEGSEHENFEEEMEILDDFADEENEQFEEDEEDDENDEYEEAEDDDGVIEMDPNETLGAIGTKSNKQSSSGTGASAGMKYAGKITNNVTVTVHQKTHAVNQPVQHLRQSQFARAGQYRNAQSQPKTSQIEIRGSIANVDSGSSEVRSLLPCLNIYDENLATTFNAMLITFYKSHGVMPEI